MTLNFRTLMELITKLLVVAIFISLSVIASIALPDFYYRYLDQTKYYQIRELTLSQQRVAPCETVDLTIKRFSEITGTLEVYVYLDSGPLVLRQGEGDRDKYALFTTDSGTVDRGEATFTIENREIPCTANPGQYLLTANFIYYVRGERQELTYTAEDRIDILPRPFNE